MSDCHWLHAVQWGLHNGALTTPICRWKPEGKLFVVQDNFEKDIFDRAALVIFEGNAPCAIVGKEFLNLCNGCTTVLLRYPCAGDTMSGLFPLHHHPRHPSVVADDDSAR